MNSTADVLLPEEDQTEEAFKKPPLLHLDRQNGSENRQVLSRGDKRRTMKQEQCSWGKYMRCKYVLYVSQRA